MGNIHDFEQANIMAQMLWDGLVCFRSIDGCDGRGGCLWPVGHIKTACRHHFATKLNGASSAFQVALFGPPLIWAADNLGSHVGCAVDLAPSHCTLRQKSPMDRSQGCPFGAVSEKEQN